jgi:Transglycosylase SLT domain
MTDLTYTPRSENRTFSIWTATRHQLWMTLSDRLPSFEGLRTLPILARTLGVAAFLCVLAVLSLAIPEDDGPRNERSYRTARVRSPASALMNFFESDDGSALDSDFSSEQAALTWAHRLRDTADIDQPGILRFGPVKVQQSVVEHVVKAAQTTDMDPALLMAIADKESNFITRAKARTSSASGLFQFVEKTWMDAMKLFGHRYGRAEEAQAIASGGGATQNRAKILGLRNDPYLSAALAAEMLKKDGAKIAEKIGRPLTAGETYLIHFLGPDDAARFMKTMSEAPNVSAAALLPRPARANRPIFYEQQGRKFNARSVAEVHEAFEEMMGKRTDRYGDVASKLPDGVAAYAE